PLSRKVEYFFNLSLIEVFSSTIKLSARYNLISVSKACGASVRSSISYLYSSRSMQDSDSCICNRVNCSSFLDICCTKFLERMLSISEAIGILKLGRSRHKRSTSKKLSAIVATIKRFLGLLEPYKIPTKLGNHKSTAVR